MRLPTRFALAVLSIASLGSALPTALPVAAAEQPLVPEKNPPGDIPDSQVFVTFTSPLGFEVKAPEGWSRQGRQLRCPSMVGITGEKWGRAGYHQGNERRPVATCRDNPRQRIHSHD